MNLSSVSVKVSSRCNLNCSYCYVFNKGDDSWRHRSPLMTEETFRAVISRIQRNCEQFPKPTLSLVFHGGEPMLLGHDRFEGWCSLAKNELQGIVELRIGIQTNGTLIDQRWIEVFRQHNVEVGISLDGPEADHNRLRLYHSGRPSFEAAKSGLDALKNAGIAFGLLSVIPFGQDPLTVHRGFVKLGCSRISYIMPHYTHDTVGPVIKEFGRTPCADFLLPIMDEWFLDCGKSVAIREFWNIARLIMGGRSRGDSLGNHAYGYLFVESDGEIEGLDILRTCGEEYYKTGLNVHSSDFADLLSVSSVHQRLMTASVPRPQACSGCQERETCSGGYFPHRHSKAKGFENASIWCADILKLFDHMRELLGVSCTETEIMRATRAHQLKSHSQVQQ